MNSYYSLIPLLNVEVIYFYDRFEGVVKSIPGTRGFHDFQTFTPISLAIKRTSNQDGPTILYNFDTASLKHYFLTQIRISSYIACIYDYNWWIGMVQSIEAECSDVEIIFMHPKGSDEFSQTRASDGLYVKIDASFYLNTLYACY